MTGLLYVHPLRRCLAGLLAAVLVSVSLVAHAQNVAPQGGSPVNFPTLDDAGKSSTLRGALFSPTGPAKGAVVLVHGAGGWNDFREGYYARALLAAGYVTLAIDSFGPRGVGAGTDHYRIAFVQMTRDAFAARRFLLERGFAADHIAVMGFSKGGTAALYAADRFFLPEQTDRFPFAIALYPTCHTRARIPTPVSTVFMGLGEKDDLTGAKQCRELADAYAKAGGKIVLKAYPDAAHGFDGDPANTRPFYAAQVERFTECVVYVEEDGRETYDGKTYPSNDPASIDAMRKSCIKKGASFWTNVQQKEAAVRDVIEFLNKSFPI